MNKSKLCKKFEAKAKVTARNSCATTLPPPAHPAVSPSSTKRTYDLPSTQHPHNHNNNSNNYNK